MFSGKTVEKRMQGHLLSRKLLPEAPVLSPRLTGKGKKT
jgi:hypothetical protein